METRRRKVTDVEGFARRLILSKEYQGVLQRRVWSGEITRDFARTLLQYRSTSEGMSLESRWLGEAPAIQVLERIAGVSREGS